MKALSRRITFLERRIKSRDRDATKTYDGIPINKIIHEMDSAERHSLRQVLLFATNTPDYKTHKKFKFLEASAKAAMDKAHYRITYNFSRHVT